MATLTVPDAEAERLGHLSEYASPGERARNQLILVVTVFVVGAALRVAGQPWWVTLPGGALIGLVVSMGVLEVWERSTGRRSARTVTEDRLTPARQRLFQALEGYTPRGDAAVLEEAGLTLTVSLRADTTPLPAPEAVERGPVHRGAPLPVRGTRYPPQGGSITVVPAVWLWIEARTGADPQDSAAEEGVGPGKTVLDDLPSGLSQALEASGAAPGLRRALSFNGPWLHRLSAWPEGLVLTTPLTEQTVERDLAKLASLLGRWHRQRLQEAQQGDGLDGFA